MKSKVFYIYRIIRRAVHLGRYDSSHKVYGVVNDAVDLGAAPQRVGILNPIAEPMALYVQVSLGNEETKKRSGGREPPSSGYGRRLMFQRS